MRHFSRTRARCSATCASSPAASRPAESQPQRYELLLDTERVALQALFDMIRRFKIGYELQLHKRTVERGLLSLIGPDAARIAAAEALPGVEHANAPVEVEGIAALAVRTDTGVDLICAAADTEPAGRRR